MADKIQVPIVSTYDDKGAKRALDDVKAIDKAKPVVKATADVKAATRDIDGLMKKVDLLDKDAATILLTSNATQIAGDITDLIIDLDRLDAEDPEVQVKADQINTLKGDLDQIETKVREVNNIPVDLDTEPAKQGVDEIGKSADSSKSALANMIGNSAQDIGALGGVAGSAGVAIGQMAEYMADAKFEGEGLGSVIRNFAGIAGPVAALAAATQLLNDVMASNAASSEAAAADTDAWVEAITSGGDAADAYAKHLEDVGKVTVEVGHASLASTGMMGQFFEFGGGAGTAFAGLGESLGLFGKNVEDLTPKLTEAGITVDTWVKAVQGGKPAQDALLDAMRAANVDATVQRDVLEGLESAQSHYGDATGKAQTVTKFFGEALGTTSEHVANLNKAYADGINPTETYNRIQEEGAAQTDRVAQIMAQAAQATQDYNDTLSSADWGRSEFDGAVAGMQRFHDQFFALKNIASDTEEAYDNFGQSLKDNGRNFDLTSEKGRNNQKALEQLASVIDVQLVSAYDAADGNQETFRQNAQRIADQTLERLQNQFHLSSDQAHDLAGRLGLLPEDIETRYTLSQTEDARQKIQLLQTAINDLPKDVQTRVNQLIIKGDYVGALNEVNGYYATHPASIQTNVQDPSASDLAAVAAGISGHFKRNPVPVTVSMVGVPVRTEHGGIARPGETTIAGEAGPEFIRLPSGERNLLMSTAIVPPGTQVTSTAETARILATMERESVTHVTVNVPRGTRPDDIVRAADRYARRNGRSRARR